jgi:putative tryptophan/tyrosine transport system substrate-binding protein
MRRREFITLLGGAVIGCPIIARAQQAAPVIGFLTSRAPGADAHLLAAFRQGLRDTGFVEGQNLAIEYRFADNQYNRLSTLAADLVQRRVAVIFANGVAAAAVKALTSTIPIVFTSGGDPVKSHLVVSLDHPGGNATGATTANIGNGAKRLELIRELVPNASTIGFFMNPDSPLTDLEDMRAAARAAGRQLVVLGIRNDQDFDTAFASLAQRGAGALVVGADPFFVSRRATLVALAARNAVPAIYFGREFTDAGGLMSYAASLAEVYRQAGIYTGRILKGAKPADLPVLAPTKFELVINLKVAKALGLDVPQSLLARADDVIK